MRRASGRRGRAVVVALVAALGLAGVRVGEVSATGPGTVAPGAGGQAVHASGEAASAPGEAARPMRVTWERAPAGAVTVTAERTEGQPAALSVAQAQLQALADRLDALRTLRPHVRWRRLAWVGGRLEGEAWAEEAADGNVALLAARALMVGWKTAGSGVRQMRGAPDGYAWHVRLLLSPPGPSGPAAQAPARLDEQVRATGRRNAPPSTPGAAGQPVP